jgi:glycerol-3-phosphate O-acyltransferase
MTPELTKTYVPNSVLRRAYERLFRNIRVDPTWATEVRRLAQQGTIVYVLRNLNFVDFLALDHLTKRYDLPQVRFVNDLGLWVLNPMGKGWLNAVLPPKHVTPADELRDALERGGSAALFLKRPPSVLDVVAGASGGRGLKEGDDLVHALFELQRSTEKPILLLPHAFIWSKDPDTRGTQLIDMVLGPREWPSPARMVGQYLYNFRHVMLKLGEPLNVAEYLEHHTGLSEEVLVRRLMYAALSRIERERRSVTGPAAKAPDRIRHEIARSPRLRTTIEELAGERPGDRAVLAGRALGMLRQLQATPDSSVLRALEATFHRVFQRLYAGIEFDPKEVDRLRSVAREGTVVLLPSHKSHVDYLVMSYFFHEQSLPVPLIAAGDNLSFFPLGPVFRRAGAFFIRRSFRGDRLYAAVVDAYIRRIIRDGYPIELFLEGGRSRTGKLLPPKFGLLNMIVDAALAVPQRKTYFVPVSIGYERVIEASSYERELQGGEKRKEDAAQLLRAPEVLRHRYGRLNLQFGQVLSLDELRAEVGIGSGDNATPARRRALVTRLGNRVMDEINRITAVTPGALTALSLLSHSARGMAHADLIDFCRKLLGELQEMGARVTPSTATTSGALRPEAIREAVQMFVSAELVRAHLPERLDESSRRARRAARAGDGAIYTVNEDKRLMLDTSKNIIVHFFVQVSMVAIAVLMPPGPPLTLDAVRERAQGLARLLKYEFRFHPESAFDATFDETVQRLVSRGMLEILDGEVTFGRGRDGWSGQRWLLLYASLLRNYLEGYQVTTRTLHQLLRGPMPEKELVKRALSVGHRMYLAGEISRREAVSQPILNNALLGLADQGYIVQREGKFELVESFATAEALATVESRLAAYVDSGLP